MTNLRTRIAAVSIAASVLVAGAVSQTRGPATPDTGPTASPDVSATPTAGRSTPPTLPTPDTGQREDPASFPERCRNEDTTTQRVCLTDHLREITQGDGDLLIAALDEISAASAYWDYFCHNAAHEVADLVEHLPPTDPRLGERRCAYGLLHGYLDHWGATVTLDEVTATAAPLCGTTDTDPSPYQSACTHGIGHAAWAASADHIEGLQACAQYDDWRRHECGGGVLMAGMLGIAGHEPVHIDTPEDAVELCDSYPDGWRDSCLTLVGRMFTAASGGDPEPALHACVEHYPHPSELDECTTEIGEIVAYHHLLPPDPDPDEAAAVCAVAGDDAARGCIHGAIYAGTRAPELYGTDLAGQLCSASHPAGKHACDPIEPHYGVHR